MRNKTSKNIFLPNHLQNLKKTHARTRQGSALWFSSLTLYYYKIHEKLGEEGIRTLGGGSPTTTFEVVTLNRSDTSPYSLFYHKLFYTAI